MELNIGDHVVLLGCSNGLEDTKLNREKIASLCQLLEKDYKLKVTVMDTVFQCKNIKRTRPAKIRANRLTQSILNPNIKAIFDLSGGDLANEVLNELDWGKLSKLNRSVFYVGFSDNTVMLQALRKYISIIPVNFQMLKLISRSPQIAIEGFEAIFLRKERLDWDNVNLIEGKELQMNNISTVIHGGNIRCFLKLAGTPYWPSEPIEALILESRSGSIELMQSFLAQLEQMGTFNELKILILGQFSQIDQLKKRNDLLNVVRLYRKKHNFSLYETPYLGHSDTVIPFCLV